MGSSGQEQECSGQEFNFFVVHVVYSCLQLSGVNSEQIRRGEEDDEGAELAEDRVAALYG